MPLVQSTTAVATGTSCTATFSAASTSGNTLYAWVCIQKNNNTSVSISVPSGWTTALTQIPSQANQEDYVGLIFAYRENAPATTSVAFTTSASVDIGVHLFERAGISPSPIDQSISAIGSSTSPASGSTGTTTQATEVITSCVVNRNDNTVQSAWTGSYTLRHNLVTTGATAGVRHRSTSHDKTVTSTGSHSIGCTLDTSRAWVAAVVTLKETANVSGTFSSTDAAESLSSTGKEAFRATLAPTEGTESLTSTGKESFRSTVAATEANDTMSSSAGSVVTGTLSTTDANDTMLAIGIAGAGNVGGAFAGSETADTLAATGKERIRGTFSTNEDLQYLPTGEVPDLITSQGKLRLASSFASTDANDSLAATATSGSDARVSGRELDDTMSSSGALKLRATMSAAEGVDGFTASALTWQDIVGTFSGTEGRDTMQSRTFILRHGGRMRRQYYREFEEIQDVDDDEEVMILVNALFEAYELWRSA